jgi:hypothetical protein
MALAKTKRRGKPKEALHEAVVPNSIIEHTKSFTAPRGKMEMGGLLFGHVDSSGRNVCVVGFFPKQAQATPSYCEFEGKWMAIGAAAADKANQVNAGQGVPRIRVIGWIHTHPDLGIFLSGTDVDTFRQNMNFSPDGRFIAVVVDPLRGVSGVFNTPDETRDFSKPKGKLEMDSDLEDRYMNFLGQLEAVRDKLGKEELPFIITGDLHNQHVSRGNPDDLLESNLVALLLLKKRVNSLEEEVGDMDSGPYSDIGKQLQLVEQENSVRASMVDEEIDRIRAGIASIEKTIEGELSTFKDMLEEKLLHTQTRPSRNSEILESIGLSTRERDSRIDALEEALGKNQELSSHILRGISGIMNVGETVTIHSEAIVQLKKSIFEIPSQLKANTDSSRNREKEEWHDFWDILNVEGTTMKQVLDEHIGLIGTNQEIAIPLIRSVLSRDADVLQEQVTPISTRVNRTVDRAVAKAAIFLRKKALEAEERLRPLSTRVNRTVDRAVAKAAIYLRKKALEADEKLRSLYNGSN